MNKTQFIERFSELFPLADRYWREHFRFIPDVGMINEEKKEIILIRAKTHSLDPNMLRAMAIAAFDFDCDYDDWTIRFFDVNHGDLQEINLIQNYYNVLEKEHSPERRQ